LLAKQEPLALDLVRYAYRNENFVLVVDLGSSGDLQPNRCD
jgi:hypothetical protein